MELNPPPVHPEQTKKKHYANMYVECLNRVLTFDDNPTLNLSELEKVSAELNDLLTQLTVQRYYYLSLDLPEYDEDFERMLRCNKRYGIVKSFLRKVNYEHKFKFMEDIALSEGEKKSVIQTYEQLRALKKYEKLRTHFVKLCSYVMKTTADPQTLRDIFNTDYKKHEDEIFMKYNFDYCKDFM